jgi:hypothetical protein
MARLFAMGFENFDQNRIALENSLGDLIVAIEYLSSD